MKAEIGKRLRQWCERKANDRGRMLSESYIVQIHVSEIVGYLKGKSSLIIFDRYANLKYKYENRRFWCRGYGVDTVGKNTKNIVNHQWKQDWMED